MHPTCICCAGYAFELPQSGGTSACCSSLVNALHVCNCMQALILFAGLSTCDPGNILDSAKTAKQHRVRVSVVGLAAEVHICRVITEVTLVYWYSKLSGNRHHAHE